MITFVSGTPGAGKTLWTVDQIRKARAGNRPVFVDGVTGLDMPGLGVFPVDVRRWMEPGLIPDGALVVVDEAHREEAFPQRLAGKKVPDYVEGLRTHRHRGLDFIVISQRPKDVDVAVRALVGRHLHLENLFGVNGAQIFEWNRCNERPADDRGARAGAIKKTWKYPKEVFTLYRSATMHTVQRRIPWKIAIIPVLLLLVVGLGWAFYRIMHGLTNHSDVQPSKQPAALTAERSLSAADLARPMVTTGGRAVKVMGPQEYEEQFVPRVASQPWSAPAFDDRKPVSKPDLYCMSREDGPCSCITEQGTHYAVKQRECRIIARYGVYNPFRDPPEERSQRSRDRDELMDEKNKGRSPADQSGTDALAGDALKGGAGAGKDGPVAWPHPDFGYHVPFPGVGARR